MPTHLHFRSDYPPQAPFWLSGQNYAVAITTSKGYLAATQYGTHIFISRHQLEDDVYLPFNEMY